MRNVRALVVLIAILAGTLVLPAGFALAADPPAADAAPSPAADAGGGGAANVPLKADNCVELGIKVTKNGTNNVCNAGAGGTVVPYLTTVLQLLSGAIGTVIILMLVIAGIQYITSGGDSAAIKKAKDRIVNALTALVLFLMSFAILNFLVPGLV